MKKFRLFISMMEELTVGGLLLVMAIGTAVQVVTRYCFGVTFDWFDEITRYLLIFITFLGAGMAVKHGAHFSMEAVVQYAPARVAAVLRMLANLCSAGMMGVISWFGWLQLMQMSKYGMKTAALGIPMWIPYLPIALFSITISVRFLHQALLQLRLAVGGGHK